MKIAPINNSLKYISNQKISRQANNVGGNYLASGGIITSSVTMQQLDIIPSFVLPIITVIAGLGVLLLTKLGINRFSRLSKSPDTNNEENGLNKNSQTQVLEKTVKEPERNTEVASQINSEIMKEEKTEEKSVQEEEISDELKTLLKTKLGNIPLYWATFYDLGFKLSNTEFGKVIDYYMQLQLQEDDNQQIPMHKFSSKEMNTVITNLRNYPDLVAELMTKRDINGEIPIHKYINDDYTLENYENFKTIFFALDNNAQLKGKTLLTVFNAKNSKGVSAIDWLKEYRKYDKTNGERVPFADTQLTLLRMTKEDYEKNAHEKYTPFIPLSDMKRKTEITEKIAQAGSVNFDSIMQILNDETVRKSKGFELNYSENYAAEIIDFLISFANSDERKTILSKLKNLDNIDYDKINSFGISTIELIMNSEDDELLDFIKDKKFIYHPELDYTFNNIQNSDFKEKIKALNFEFLELKDAIYRQSAKDLEKYISQTDSPLYKKDVNGLDIKVPSGVIIRPSFFKVYDKYYFRIVPRWLNECL